MPDYWIDSNIFIMARRGVLTFDIAPRFWSHLDTLGQAGRISSPLEVYNELNTHFPSSDPLITWVQARVNSHFTPPHNAVQTQFTRVSNHVIRRYTPSQVDEFLGGADPWLIAHAIESGGSVVTNETPTQEPGPNRNTGLIDTKVKIPNVCRHFGVATVSLSAMLRALGVNDL